MVFKKGHIVSNETKEKLKVAMALRKEKYGYINSPQTRLKISNKQKGRIRTFEELKHLRENAAVNKNYGMRGKHFSKESKIKMSESHKNKIPWNKGLTKETDERVRLIRKTPMSNVCKKIVRTRREKKNYQHSKESKIKMSESHKNKIPWNKGKTPSEKEIMRLKEMRKNQIFPKKDTKIEIKVREFLEELKIEYFQHKYISEITHSYQCDFFIPSMNLVIECDGNYWHKYPTGRDIDHIRTKELLEKGFKVLRLWEFEIKEMDLNKFKEKLIPNFVRAL
jgi:very-short-patch-repair endonuclease